MASALNRRRKGAAGAGSSTTLLTKLEQSVMDGDYYQALQMYKTSFNRYMSKDQETEAIDLLASGTAVLLKKAQHNSASELANYLIDHLHANQIPPASKHLVAIEKMASSYNGADGSLFLKTALKWTKEWGRNTQGEPRVHHLLAQTYRGLRNFP